MKNSYGTIGNRTRDLQACRAVPKATASPRAPLLMNKSVTVYESSNPSSRSLAYPKCRKVGAGASRCFLGLLSIVMYYVWLKVESDTRVNKII
jgi:hypothetical protein